MGIRKHSTAWPMYRMACRCVVKLHPRVFREQFGEEMIWIFEEATDTHGAFRLLGDGLLSLTRQWVFRPRSLDVAVAASAVFTSPERAWFSWEHLKTSPHRLPPRG